MNKNALDGFSKLFLRVLDRLFGEYVTGYIAIIDEKHWTKGDHGGWIRLVNSNTRSTLAPANTNNTNTNSNATNKVPGASSVKSSVSGFSSSFLSAASEVTGSTDRITSSSLAADEYIIRLLSPHSNVMEIFLYQYKQREYAMRVEIFPQKIKALLSGNTLLRCYSSPVIRTLGTHLQSRCTNQVSAKLSKGHI